MIVKGTAVLQAGIRSEFIKAYQTGPSFVPTLCTIVPSNKDTESYAWLGEVTAIREWLGEREITGLTDAKFSIQNKLWEGTIGVKRTEIEDDQTGGIMVRARDLGTRARQHPDDLLWQTVVANPTCYDGVSLFNASHPARTTAGSAQSNQVSATGQTVSALQADIASAIAKMKGFLDERGKPFWPVLAPQDLLIVCSPSLEFNMRTVVNGSIISNTTNVMQGCVGDIFVNPWITGNTWYLFYKGGAVKPFIFQDREPITLDDRLNDSEQGFLRDIYLFGSRARYNAGPGLWQAAVKVA